jgi:hypothetical protein
MAEFGILSVSMAGDGGPQTTLLDVLALKAADGGRSEHDVLINAFLEAVVALPSGTEPGKGPVEPVIVEIDGVSHMLVCDSLATVGQVTDLACYAVSMRGADVVRGTGPGYAILVRTSSSGFGIDGELLDEIRSRRVD